MLYSSKKKSGTPVQSNHLVWKHNGLLGQVKRAEVAMRNVYDAETTTDLCRQLAAEIEAKLTVLFRELHTRRDTKIR